MGDDKIIRDLNKDSARKREEDRLKSLLGAGFKGGKKAQRIDISGIVGLLTTKAEFGHFKTTVHSALTKIEGLLGKLKSKVDLSTETADVLGRLLATLERKGISTQDDLVETGKLIAEGQRLVNEIIDENSDKTLDELLVIMGERGVNKMALEEFEHIERRKAANRIIALHGELSKPVEVDETGKVIVAGKTFKEIVETFRAEFLPEAQIREYLRAFFPWADGRDGPGEFDVLFCPECDRGFSVSPNPDGDLLLCECGKKLFPASDFERPPEFGGENEVEEPKTPEADVDPECICHETTVGKDECPVHGKHPALEEAVEDPGLVCPPDVESGEGHYDPSTSDPEEDGFPCCAGCGCPRSEHTRVVKLVTPSDEALDEAEGCGSDEDVEEGEVEDDSRDDE